MSDRSKYLKEYKKQNADRIREQNKEYKKRNAERIKEQREEYRKQKDKIREQTKEYKERNKEKIKEGKLKIAIQKRKEEDENKINDEYPIFDSRRVLSIDDLENYRMFGRNPIICPEKEKKKLRKYKSLKLELANRRRLGYYGVELESKEEELSTFLSECRNEYVEYIKSIPSFPLDMKIAKIEEGKEIKKSKLSKAKKPISKEIPEKVQKAIEFYEKSDDPFFLDDRKPYYCFIQQFPDFFNIDEVIDLLYNGPK